MAPSPRENDNSELWARQAEIAHTLVNAARGLKWNLGDLDLLKTRIREVDFGLSAEDEFSALLHWLGRCSLVHGLEQPGLRSPAGAGLRIPDLLAVFQREKTSVSALIEVKSTKSSRLAFTPRYMEGLQRYARSVGVPLLIAWRPRSLGFWVLFDPVHLVPEAEKLIIRATEVMKNDLLTALAGHFVVSPYKGIGLCMRLLREGDRVEAPDGYYAHFRVEEAWWQGLNSTRLHQLSRSAQALVFAGAAMEQHLEGDELNVSIRTHGGMVPIQSILKTQLLMSVRGEGLIRWRREVKRFDTIVSRDELARELSSHFGSIVQYIFHLLPQAWPEFIPREWRKAERGERPADQE